ncbi:MAG: hypothetical protein WBQ73_04125 [Candidatus Babeliales bacterium]
MERILSSLSFAMKKKYPSLFTRHVSIWGIFLLIACIIHISPNLCFMNRAIHFTLTFQFPKHVTTPYICCYRHGKHLNEYFINSRDHSLAYTLKSCTLEKEFIVLIGTDLIDTSNTSLHSLTLNPQASYKLYCFTLTHSSSQRPTHWDVKELFNLSLVEVERLLPRAIIICLDPELIEEIIVDDNSIINLPTIVIKKTSRSHLEHSLVEAALASLDLNRFHTDPQVITHRCLEAPTTIITIIRPPVSELTA